MTQLTWETATDWDNAQSESRVVHENLGDKAAAEVRLGWPATSFWEGIPAPVAHWHFEEDSGSTLNDVSGNGHDASIVGGPTPGGRNGELSVSAWNLDGGDDGFDIPHDAVFNSAQGTWVAIVYPEDVTNRSDVMDKTGGGANSYHMYFKSGDFNVGADTPGGFEGISAGISASTGQVYTVGLQYSEGSSLSAWVNGTQENSTSGDFSMENTNTFTLGYNFDNGLWFDGWLGEVAYWDSNLSASQMSALHNVLVDGTLTTGKKTS